LFQINENKNKIKKLVLQQKREKVIEKLNYLQEASKQIVDLFQDEEVLNKLRQEKQHNIKFLKDQYNVGFYLFIFFLSQVKAL